MRARAITSLVLALVLAACGSFGSSAEPPSTTTPMADAGSTDSDASDRPTADASDATDATTTPSGDVLASGQSLPKSITANEAFVYWSVSSPGAVRRVALAGGQVFDVDSSGGSPMVLRVDADDDLVWADDGVAPGLRRVRAGTGAMIDRFYADSAFAFAPTTFGFAVLRRSDEDIRLLDIGGTVNGGFGPYGSPFDVAANGADVYFTESSTGRIMHVLHQASPTNPVLFLQGETDCRNLVSWPQGLAWTLYSQGKVRIRESSGLISEVAGEDHPYGLAADASGVYWLTPNGRLRRWSGGTTTTIAEGFGTEADQQVAPYRHAVALTQSYVVWLTQSEVRRIAK